MTRADTIPLDRIAWIKIYHAKRYRERDMAKVLTATGGDLCFNGTIFSWATWKPLCYCKADGKYLCNPGYNVQGVVWDNAGDFRQGAFPTASANGITCVPLIENGKAVAKPNYQKDMGGKRPRTAIGVKEGRFAYYVTSDGYTPEALRDLLARSGWDTAIMLDGGGSVCFRDNQGKGFCCDKGRTIPHYIVVKLKDNEPKGDKPMTTIYAYSLKKDGGKKAYMADNVRCANFRVKEFACNDGSDTVFIAPALVMLLQSIRSHFGKPVHIHSGYRTPAYNEKVGGAENSQHLYGTAADISVSGITPAKVADYARQIMSDWGGVGIYAKQGFTHIDVREVKADWLG